MNHDDPILTATTSTDMVKKIEKYTLNVISSSIPKQYQHPQKKETQV